VLASRLSQIHAIEVTSSISARQYKATDKRVPDIARELLVDGVVACSVQRAAGHLLVTVQLIDGSTDTLLWSNTYDRDATDFLAVQSEIVTAIAREIQVRLTREEETRIAKVRSIRVDALEAYVRGLNNVWRSEAELKQAIPHFEEAVRLQPDYASAWAALSLSSGLHFDSYGDPQSERRARDAAQKALDLDPNLADARAAAAAIRIWDWEWAEAVNEFARAFELNPDSVDTCACYAVVLAMMGRRAEARELIDRAAKVNPLSARVQQLYATVLYAARHYEEAERHGQRALQLDPQSLIARLTQAVVYQAAGNIKESLRLLDPPEFADLAIRGVSLALDGNRAEAQRIAATPTAASDPTDTALIYFALGDDKMGFQWLTKAVDVRHPNVRWLKVAPHFDRQRSDQRFIDLLARLKFPE
jgi:tetratricopeptide (TPR) repeat protein